MNKEMSWGYRWCDMLSKVADQRRVSRGRLYAANGTVSDLTIVNGIGTAVVKATVMYRVKFQMPQFTQAEKDCLVRSMMEKPRLLDLLNRRLYEGYWEAFLEKSGISLFPTYCSELGFSCSCPDASEICEHVVAVILFMSEQIEADPFILFRWRGLDLREALGQQILDVGLNALPEVDSLSRHLKVVNPVPTVLPDYTLEQDYSSLPDAQCALFALLPKWPLFYPDSDFRDFYMKRVSAVSRSAGYFMDIFGSEARMNSTVKHISKDAAVRIFLDASLQIQVEVCFEGASVVLDGVAFQKALEAIPATEVCTYHRSLQWLWYAYRFVLHVAAKGLFQAMWLRIPNACYRVIWYPSPISSELVDLCHEWEVHFPQGILFLRDVRQAVDVPGRWVLRVLLMTFIRRFSGKVNEGVEGVFFKMRRAQIAAGHESFPMRIQEWLDAQSLHACRYQPMMIVEEVKDGFTIRLCVRDTASGHTDPIDLACFMQDSDYASFRMAVYHRFRALLYLDSGFQRLFDSLSTEPLLVDGSRMAVLLEQVFPQLPLLGFYVLLPKSMEGMLIPRIVASIGSPVSNFEKIRLFDLLRFDIRVALGDHQVPLSEFQKMVKNADGLIRYKGRYFLYDRTLLKRIKRLQEKKNGCSSAEVLETALSGQFEDVPVSMSNELRTLVKRLDCVDGVDLPKGLQATLRPYQASGFAWLYRNASCGIGSILADDMGLGKTLQVIAFLLKAKEERGGRYLVIAPTGLLSNWKREVERFAPTLSVFVYHGGKRDLSGFNEDILLTSYHTVRNDKALLCQVEWEVVVIDEAQAIKNPKAALSKAIMSIRSNTRIAMSGTPVENRLTELWSIMQFVNPGLLGSLSGFTKSYVTPIQKNGDVGLADRLKRMSSPFLLRRLKTDRTIIQDLPDKVERNVYVSLVPEQAALYQSTLNRAMQTIGDMPDAGDKRLMFERQRLVLRMLLSLKQICNHPAQFLKEDRAVPGQSGKMVVLFDLIEGILESGEKVLVFTQYREMGELLVKAIKERFNRVPLFYHGGLNVASREALVERFQNDPADQVFIVTLKAAGTGLNLTAASHVVHYDLWWNPAMESQATDRAYRIGQHKNVQVHRLISEGTFEERIDALINKKRTLADMTVATGEQWIGNLSNKELKELLSS